MDDISKLEDFDIDNILIDEKSHKNILIYDVSYKTFTAPKPLRLIFDKIDRFIRIYDGNRYLVLVGLQKYDSIYNKIRCPISPKSSITYIFCHYFTKIKIDSYDPLPIKKILTLYNVILLSS